MSQAIEATTTIRGTRHRKRGKLQVPLGLCHIEEGAGVLTVRDIEVARAGDTE